MLHKTKGIVLHSLKYGDSGLVVTLYTEAFGRMSFLLQGVRSKKSPRRGNLIQPLFQLDLEVDHKPDRELQRVREMKIALPYSTIPFEIGKSTQALFLAEILNKVLKEEESRPELFHFLITSLQLFDLLEEGSANFHLLFLIQLSRFLGFGPTTNFCPSEPIFDLIAGSFVARPPSHPHFMNREESLLFAELLDMNYPESKSLHLNKEIRNSLLNLIIDYYSLHLGINLNIKSLEVLHELFR